MNRRLVLCCVTSARSRQRATSFELSEVDVGVIFKFHQRLVFVLAKHSFQFGQHESMIGMIRLRSVGGGEYSALKTCEVEELRILQRDFFEAVRKEFGNRVDSSSSLSLYLSIIGPILKKQFFIVFLKGA